MASYNIVLNLSGNAVGRVEKLAAALATANANATSLAASLGAVGTAGRGLSVAPIRVANAGAASVAASARYNNPYFTSSTTTGAVNIHNAALKMNAAAVKMNAAANTQNVAASKQRAASTAHAYQTRHAHTRIGSFGTGFHFGPFSGRLSTILQPDENGMLLGMDAKTLMTGANMAGIATHMAASIGKAGLKTVAVSTIAPFVVGGGGLSIAMRTLNSENFAGGVRLISRRHQSQLGLGRDYEQANYNTDFLAAAYGLDRSTTLSSINVLTGLGVGGTSRKISLNEATGLTKVGGLISQHYSVPFERVMTNIQQLLVQQTPHMRDIRELLNQAPILGKYAVKDMEEKGIKGVDVRTYLKDQNAIMSVLKRYEIDVATNAGMQARGRIALAQQGLWAKIAGNEEFWRYTGRAGSGVIGSMGNAFDKLLSTLANSDSFRVMIKQIEHTFDNFETKGVTFVDKLITFVERAAERLDIDLGDRKKSKEENQRERGYESLASDKEFRAMVERNAVGSYVNEKGETIEFNHFADASTPQLHAKILDGLVHEAIHNLISQPDYMQGLYSHGVGKLADASSDYAGGLSNTPGNRRRYNESVLSSAMNVDTAGYHVYIPNRELAESYDSRGKSYASRAWNYLLGNDFMYKRNETTDPAGSHALMLMGKRSTEEITASFLRDRSRVGGIDPALLPGAEEGDDLTGVNSDRRSLVINFNAPIVDGITNQINSNDPQQVAAEVFENAEDAISAGIQKALLGATSKMRSNFI